MASCQLLDGKMCSCMHEKKKKEKNKWELCGRDLCSERTVTCKVWFHFLMREDSNSERLGKIKYFLRTIKDQLIKR